MTDASCRPLPFWKRKRLEEMTEEEWESLCDGCGRCCLEKVGADDAQETFALDIACNLLDIHKGRCGDYANRLDRHVGCFQFSPETIDRMGVVPETCAYDRVRKGKDLAWWHPLISGRPDTVHEAGISVRGRAIPGRLAGRWEFHSVTWPAQDPVQAWMRARFGG
ncbi:MAG: YcgN family cysteine cluster protein, partial [Rhodospirillales bacterium]|nr:YcgN family cysteine cluster protein [Acetobacter sp.]